MTSTETAEYPESFARFYDTIYAHLRTVDRDYFLRTILATKGPVLEIGVGTGRFFIDALTNGADIYGVDVSESMLRQLRKKLDERHHQRIFLQDARSLHLNKTFDLIVAPFRVFSHLIEPEDQLRALNSIYDHLNPGGRFIFDLYVPDLGILLNGIKEQVDFEGEYAPGKKLKRVVSARSDLIRQVNSVTMTLVWDDDNGEKTESWNLPMRYYFRYELEYLVQRSKLSLKHIYGDYEEHELSSESKDFIVVCGRRQKLSTSLKNEMKYLEQWERVKRWWSRFGEISKGRVYLDNTEFSEDEIFSFFLNCYHLKDWIKNDPTSGRLSDLVEEYVNKSEALSICADLCNGLKHLERDPKRVRKNAKFGPQTHRISLGSDSALIALSYTIETDSGSFDALEIAAKCLVEWENFFNQNRKHES